MWHTHAMNPTIVEAFYGKKGYIELNGSIIHEIKFIPGEDNVIELCFDDINFPENPPEKWLNQKYNTAQVRLQFSNVINFSFSYRTSLTKVQVSISINSINDDKLFLFAASDQNGLILKFNFKWLYIEAITGYISELKPKR